MYLSDFTCKADINFWLESRRLESAKLVDLKMWGRVNNRLNWPTRTGPWFVTLSTNPLGRVSNTLYQITFRYQLTHLRTTWL